MPVFNILSLLSSCVSADVQFSADRDTSNGWKLSLQGKCIEDAAFLFRCLDTFLSDNNIPYKVGTQKRFNARIAKTSKLSRRSKLDNLRQNSR